MSEQEKRSALGAYESPDACYASGGVKTAFATDEDIDSMHKMMEAANPEAVLDVADAWEHLYKRIANSQGSIKSDFDKAVDHVLQHWEGESADEFAKKAKKVSKQLEDCSTYAQYTSVAMHSAGKKLSEIKPQVLAIEKPSWGGSKLDALGDGFTRDDKAWRSEISGNRGAQKALDSHDDDLSAGREEQLKAAAKMEDLAMTYTGQMKSMGSWAKRGKEEGGSHYPGEPGGIAPVPAPVLPGDYGTAGGPSVARGRTGTGGNQKSSSATPSLDNRPGSGTRIDGITGGADGRTGQGSGPRISGSGAATAGGNNHGVLAGGFAGSGGTTAAGRAGGPGLVGKASGNRGVSGGAAGAGTSRGAAGGLRGGIGSGSSAGGKGAGASAGGRGPLARQRGGAPDTPVAGKSSAKQGGSGLHSSRGGTAAGQRGRAGMIGSGAAGKKNDRRSGTNEEGQRPDYLVEDEETWMPKRRDVTPPTIG